MAVENYNRMVDLAQRMRASQIPLADDLVGRLQEGKPTYEDFRTVRTIEKSLARVGNADSLLSLVWGNRHPSAASDQNQFTLARALRMEIGSRVSNDWILTAMAAGVHACV